ncbi:MAG: triose-phosphate isomerase [Bacteroidetes bacterium]|nr:triose-phosphate isomerase [Bacteroidota bacterium]MBU2585008.1 triose-phosphate isomerase [Bacteroidota bacterium]
MRKKVVAGNWKMYKDKSETIELISGLKEKLSKFNSEVEVIICPPFTSIEIAKELLKGSVIHLGAQNMHFEDEGAFTGEISAKMLKSFGVEYVILGHSERRSIFREDDKMINKKVLKAVSVGLKPIFCIGETLEERENNKTFDVIARQLTEGLSSISNEHLNEIIVAYEPVWAIGTGKTATPSQAEEVHKYLRKLIEEKFGRSFAESMRILYGGSVKPDNAKELFSQPNIDGGLIGGACLKADSFYDVINSAV